MPHDDDFWGDTQTPTSTSETRDFWGDQPVVKDDYTGKFRPLGSPDGSIGSLIVDVLDKPFQLGRNIIGDFGDIARGVSTVLKMGIGDTIRLTKEIATLGRAETTGYDLARLVRALPSAVAQDYKRRYGSWPNFFRGLWEDPLFFLTDVSMVAGAVGLAAKGAVGAGIISETGPVARAILGPGEIAIRSLTSSDVWRVSLPSNPARRLLQETTLRLVAASPNSARAQSWLNTFGEIAERAAAEGALTRAASAGGLVFKPGFSRTMESVKVARTIASLGLKIADRRDPAVLKVNNILKQAGDDPRIVFDYLKGARAAAEDTPPRTIIGNARLPGEVPLSPTMAPLGQRDVSTARTLVRIFGPPRAGRIPRFLREAGLPRPVDIQDFPSWYSPLARIEPPTKMDRYVVYVPDLREAVTAHQRIVNESGWQVEGFVSRLDDPGWLGVHGRYRDPVTGAGIEVSFATPDLFEAQRAVSDIYSRLDSRAEELRATLGDLPPDRDTAVAMARDLGLDEEAQGRVYTLAREMDAGRALATTMFDHSRRAFNAGDVAWDPALMAAERLRPVIYNHMLQPLVDKGELSFTRIMDDSYLMHRIDRFDEIMEQLTIDFKHAIETAKRQGLGWEGAVYPMVEALEEYFGANNPLIDRIFNRLDFPDEDPERAARILVDDVKFAAFDKMIIEADYPTFRWEDFFAEYQAEPRLTAPTYYPQRPVEPTRLSDLVFKGRTPTLSLNKPLALKKDMAKIYEEGLTLKNPAEAYRNLANSIAVYIENTRELQRILDEFGRKMTFADLLGWSENQYQGFVIVNPTQAVNELLLQAKTLATVHSKARLWARRLGPSLEKARLQARRLGIALKTETQADLENLFVRALKDEIKIQTAALMDDLYLLPRHIAEKFQHRVEIELGQKAHFYWDGFMNLWKKSVLSLSPRWLVNNVIGNAVFIGLKEPSALLNYLRLITDREARAVAELMFGPALMDDVGRTFVHGAALKIDWSLEETTKQHRLAEQIMRFPLSRGVSRISQAMTELNVYFERGARLGVALSEAQKSNVVRWGKGFVSTYRALEAIAREGLPSGQVWERTLTKIDQVLGDYLVMGPYEKNILRRWLLPFYAFYRHTAKFLARMPLDHPIKSAVLGKIEQIDEEMNAFMPPFLRNAVRLIDLGKPEFFVRIANLNPLQALVGETDTEYRPFVLSTVNPLIKMFLERQIGINTFTGEPFRAPSGTVIETFRGTQYEVLRTKDGKFAGVRRLSSNWMPPLAQHVINLIPQTGLIPGIDIYYREPARIAAGFLGVPLIRRTEQELLQDRIEQIVEDIEALGRGAAAYAKSQTGVT